MFDSALIDIAIGLSLVFLLFSLLVSAASEMVASIFKWRATQLWDGIEKLLQSSQARDELYRHPLIRGLSVSRPLNERDRKDGRSGPSYIPSKTFALALLDTLRAPHAVARTLTHHIESFTAQVAADPARALADLHSALTALDTDDRVPEEVRAEIKLLAKRWSARMDGRAVAALRTRVDAALASAPDAAVQADIAGWLAAAEGTTGIELRSALLRIVGRIAPGEQGHRTRKLLEEIAAGIHNGDPAVLRDRLQQTARSILQAALGSRRDGLGRALGSLLTDAADDVERFRENIEIWFNDGMDRVSGAYKRSTMKWQFGIALALAVVLNVDALLIARALWREPTLRKAIADQGAAVAQSPPPSLVRRELTARGQAGARELVVELSSPTVQEGFVQTAYVSVPGAAEDTTVDVEAASAHVELRERDRTDGHARLAITVPPGGEAQKVPVYIASRPVKAESLERVSFSVTSGTDRPRTAIEIVAVPPAGERYDALQKQLSGLGLPIGWSCGDQPADAQPANRSTAALAHPRPFWCNGGAFGGGWDGLNRWSLLEVLALLIGWGITASAAALGAPFWFDTLKRVVAIRGAGKAPEERPLAPKEVPQPREPGQRPVEADLLKSMGG